MNEWNEDFGTRLVVTWKAPGGPQVNLTERQAMLLDEAEVWPRATSGEYCQVSRGLHRGYPTWSDEYVSWCAHYALNPADKATFADFVRYREWLAFVNSLPEAE